MDRKSRTNQIIIIALFIAMEVILTRFLSIQTPIIRLGFGFLPIAMLAIMYGPVWAGVAYAVGDILGMLLWPVSGPFFPGFTLTAFLTGVVFGLVLYKKEVTITRVLLASLLVVIPLNLGLDTLWLSILFNKAFVVLLPTRIVKCVITIFIQTALIPTAYHLIVRRLPGYTPRKSKTSA